LILFIIQQFLKWSKFTKLVLNCSLGELRKIDLLVTRTVKELKLYEQKSNHFDEQNFIMHSDRVELTLPYFDEIRFTKYLDLPSMNSATL
jgi:hypothetical protein